MERDAKGRWAKGNRTSKQGFSALAKKYFKGNKRACAAWLFDPLGYQQKGA